MGQIKQRLVVAGETADQLRFEPAVFSGRKRKFVRLNRNKKRIQVLFSVGAAVEPGGANRQRPFVRLMTQLPGRLIA